jgi:hypothetical protein
VSSNRSSLRFGKQAGTGTYGVRVFRIPGASEPVRWADDAAGTALVYVGVDHGRGNVLMPEPFLHGTVWSTEAQSADWFVGAADAASLESALRIVWDIDEVGKSFYDCSENAKGVPAKLKADA